MNEPQMFTAPAYVAAPHPTLPRWMRERDAVWFWLKNLEAAGFDAVKVDDGGDEWIRVATLEEALDAVMAVDEATVIFKAAGEKKGYCVVFILGNSPREVAADMSWIEGSRWNAAIDAICEASERHFED